MGQMEDRIIFREKTGVPHFLVFALVLVDIRSSADAGAVFRFHPPNIPCFSIFFDNFRSFFVSLPSLSSGGDRGSMPSQTQKINKIGMFGKTAVIRLPIPPHP